MYIYVLGKGGWLSHPVAFVVLFASFTVYFTTKLLFLQHKLTDISSIRHKKVLYFCHFSKCDHKLAKDAQYTLSLVITNSTYPPKATDTYIIQNRCSYFVLISNAKSLFLLYFLPGSKNTTRT